MVVEDGRTLYFPMPLIYCYGIPAIAGKDTARVAKDHIKGPSRSWHSRIL